MKKRGKKAKKKQHRNSAGGAAPAPPRRRRVPINRAPPPDFKTTLAAAAASVGSSLVSGLLVNQRVMEPETVSMMMAGIGGVGAYLTGGDLRVACSSVASVGAGQYALVKLGKAALRHNQAAAHQQQFAAPPQQQLQAPAPPPAPQRPQSATGGGYVVDMFRDAASDLELIAEDEYRYGARDADPGEYLEIDLDAAA